MKKLFLFLTVLWATHCFASSAVELYGFVMPVWSTSSSGVESFSQPNMTAYTAAGNPVSQLGHESGRATFHVGQSRLGVLVHPTEKVTGRLEVDFVDFSKSSPTTAAFPRVRRAVVEIPLAENVTMALGQDWDVVSPQAPHSFNVVGHLFESGDIGFMRLQGRVTWKVGDWEHTVAIGLPTSNNTSSDQAVELGMLPVFELAESVAVTNTTKIGLSGVAASVRRTVSSTERFFAGALSAFASSMLTPSLELRTEAYVARNGSNLGLLGLSYGNATASSTDAGAYVSSRWGLGTSAIFAVVGSAWVLNPSDVLPAYTVTGSPGMERNSTVRLGYEYSFSPNCVFFTEFAYLNTRHHLDVAHSGVESTTSAFLNQTGVQVKL